MGIFGSAVSNLATQLVFFVLIYSIAQQQYTIPYEIKKVGLMIILAAALFAISWWTNSLLLWIRLPLKFVLIALFPLLLLWFGFYEPVEKERLAGFWSKWKNPAKWRKNLMELEL